MATFTFDLLFLKPKKGDLPGPAISEIYLKSSSKSDYRGIPKDLTLITRRCMSIGELEYEIDRLKAELEKIKIKARKEYAAFRVRRGRDSN